MGADPLTPSFPPNPSFIPRRFDDMEVIEHEGSTFLVTEPPKREE